MKNVFLIAAVLVAACGSGERAPPAQPADSAPTVDSVGVDSGGATAAPASQQVQFVRANYKASVAAAVDSSTYTVSWRVSGFTTGDTVQVKLVRDSVASLVKRVSITKNLFITTGKQAFRVDKIYGTVAKYTSCVRLRRTVVKSELCQSWTTNFVAAPNVDTMSVDSSLAIRKLDLKPDKIDSVQYGQAVQFCAFIVFKDGKVAIRSEEKTKPDCVKYYGQFALASRSVSVGQQLVADRLCLKWEATGGTIGASVCSTPSPLTNS